MIRHRRFAKLLHLVQHISKIEERQRIVRIGDRRTAIELLGPHKVPLIVVNRSQVDERRSMVRSNDQDQLVQLSSVWNRRAIFLKLHRAQKHLLQLQAALLRLPFG